MSGPWNNQIVSLIILTEALTGFSGLFGYSPDEAAGNLILAISAAPGTDPDGNSYPGGVYVVNPATGQSAQLSGGQLDFLFDASQFGPGQVYENAAGELLLGSGQVTKTDTAANVVLFSEQANSGQTEISLQANTVTTTGSFSSANSATFDGTQILNGEVILGTKASPPPGYPFSSVTANDLNNIVNILIAVGLVS